MEDWGSSKSWTRYETVYCLWVLKDKWTLVMTAADKSTLEEEYDNYHDDCEFIINETEATLSGDEVENE